jgi:iron complex transport system ATP-binding protein
MELSLNTQYSHSHTITGKFIRCIELTVGYSKLLPVISGVNCEIQQGDFVVLLGRNGQGKSSLLKTLLSIIPPLNGKVDHNLPTIPFQKSIAYVPSNLDIYGFVSVEEYIGFGRYQHTNFFGTLQQEDKDAIKSAIEIIGIEHLQKRQFSTLSDGEKQKCHIARAIAQEPIFLILDEPTSHLDPPTKRSIISLLHTISTKNIGVLFSTHDIHSVSDISKSIWYVERNSLIVSKEHDAIPMQLQSFYTESGIKKA